MFFTLFSPTPVLVGDFSSPPPFGLLGLSGGRGEFHVFYVCEQLIVGLCLAGRVCKTHPRRGKRATAQPAKHSRAFPVLEENMMWGFAYSSAAINKGPHLELSFSHLPSLQAGKERKYLLSFV